MSCKKRDMVEKDVARMVYYFRKDVKYSNEYYIYTPSVMVAEIGGYVGLLLGISLFDLSLLIDYILEAWFRHRSIETRKEITVPGQPEGEER